MELVNKIDEKLELNLQKYAGHEYYATLPFKLNERAVDTSNLKAGSIYYWKSGNSFVVNYEDYDISPYNSTYIGKFEDNLALNEFQGDNVNVTIKR